jgi:hypothetical protein
MKVRQKTLAFLSFQISGMTAENRVSNPFLCSLVHIISRKQAVVLHIIKNKQLFSETSTSFSHFALSPLYNKKYYVTLYKITYWIADV